MVPGNACSLATCNSAPNPWHPSAGTTWYGETNHQNRVNIGTSAHETRMPYHLKTWHTYWLVVLTILKNISQLGRIIPYIMENKKCLKPQTSWYMRCHSPTFCDPFQIPTFPHAQRSKVLVQLLPCGLSAEEDPARPRRHPQNGWFIMVYPLVNIQKTMENHHFEWEIMGTSTISMAIFYVAFCMFTRG